MFFFLISVLGRLQILVCFGCDLQEGETNLSDLTWISLFHGHHLDLEKASPNSKPFSECSYLSSRQKRKNWNTSPQSHLFPSIFATWQRQNQRFSFLPKSRLASINFAVFLGWISQFWEHEFLPMSPPNQIPSPASQPPTSVPATWQYQPMALRYECYPKLLKSLTLYNSI